MRDPFDAWYIRLPDGRVVRAKSAASVRHHLQTGRIPVECWVRRSGEDDWTSLEWTVEFADLATAKRQEIDSSDESPRPKADRGGHTPIADEKDRGPAVRNLHELHTVGVRGLADELFAALDSTLNGPKLGIAGGACLGISGLMAGLRWADFGSREAPWPWLGLLLAFLAMAAMAGLATTLLTQMTFVELSRLRRPRWAEVTRRLGAFSLRIVGNFLLVAGAVVLAIVGLRFLPGWVMGQEDNGTLGSAIVAALAAILSIMLEVFLWPILGLVLLLAPVVIVEESSYVTSILQWWSLIRRHLGRVILYEGLAAALGAIITMPFLFPVLLAGWHTLGGAPQADVPGTTLTVLAGCALTPLVAYLVVANVFIYINLRYEFSASSRE